MQNVYFISGLGADRRVFQLLDLSFCHPVFIEWISPLPGESISEYAARLRAGIPEENPIIVGLSFGGMIGVEISRQMEVEKLVLLSSAKYSREIPPHLRILKYLPLHMILPPRVIRAANELAYRLMGISRRNDKMIFKGMLKEADDGFVAWAIHQVITWKNDRVYCKTIHIHGSSDILLPYRFVKADFTVEGGEHLMLLTKPDEISALLKQVITGT